MRIGRAIGRWLPEGFGSNTLMLAGSTAAGQALLILASPLLSRLYSPGDFGAYGVYLSLLSFAAVVVALRYEFAIPVADTANDAFHLTVLAVGIVLFMSVGVGALAFVWGPWLSRALGAPRLAPFLWLLSLSVLALGTYSVLSHWAVRARAFSTLGRTRLHKSVAQVGTQVAAALLRSGPAGLVVGDVVGRSASCGALAVVFLRSGPEGPRTIRWGRLREVARRYRGFPLLTSPSAVLYTISQSMPPLALSVLYGPEVAGFYVLAERVLDLPVGVIGEAVSQVYLGEAAALRDEGIGRVAQLHWGLLRTTLALGAGFVILSLAAPLWVPWVFGAAWAEAGTYIAILSVTYGLRLPAMAVSRTNHLTQRLDLDLWKELFRAVLVVATFSLSSIVDLRVSTTLLLLSGANTLGFGGYIYLASRALRNPRWNRQP